MGTNPHSAEEVADLPVAVWTGSFRLFGVDVICHVLSDGRRVIDAESMAALMAGGNADADDQGNLQQFSEWQRGGGNV